MQAYMYSVPHVPNEPAVLAGTTISRPVMSAPHSSPSRNGLHASSISGTQHAAHSASPPPHKHSLLAFPYFPEATVPPELQLPFSVVNITKTHCEMCMATTKCCVQ